ncbi:Uncharacterised protein [Klebsiella pneumoniae]|nr:Uncharacterised protein [Klebsiella pneumoniae]
MHNVTLSSVLHENPAVTANFGQYHRSITSWCAFWDPLPYGREPNTMIPLYQS